MNTRHTNLSETEIANIKRAAKNAAYRALRGDVKVTADSWWVGEYCYEIGAVDSRGMVDVEGERARLFTAERKRVVRRG